MTVVGFLLTLFLSTNLAFAFVPCVPEPSLTKVVDVEGTPVTVTYTKGRCGISLEAQNNWWERSDPASCRRIPGSPDSRENCSKCLVGPEWDALRQELGYVPELKRPSTVILETGNWLGPEITTSIMRIILEEMMGYTVQPTTMSGAGLFARAARPPPGHVMMVLESWDHAKQAEITYYVKNEVNPKPFTVAPGGGVSHDGVDLGVTDATVVAYLRGMEEEAVDHGTFGTIGRESLYVFDYMLEKDRTAVLDHWRGFLTRSNLQHLSPDGTTRCERKLSKGSSCDDPAADFVCPKACPLEGAPWTGDSCCFHGKWYPPQCLPEGVTAEQARANASFVSPHCPEVLMANPLWAAGWFESAVAKNGLNLSFTYLGYQGLIDELLERHAAKRNGLFFWWEPEPMVARVGAYRMSLPHFTDACGAAHKDDPVDSGVTCDFPAFALGKAITKSASVTDPDVYNLWTRYTFTDADQDSIFRAHTAGGGSQNTEQVGCAWLKANVGVWKPWVRNTKTRCTAEDYSSNVSACSGNSRLLTFAWKQPRLCFDNIDKAVTLPPPRTLDCPYVQAEGVAQVFNVVALLLLGLTLALMGLVVSQRSVAVFRHAQPAFLLIMLTGGVITYADVLLWSGPPTPERCLAAPLALSFGFTLIFGSLIVKTLRIKRLFLNRKMKKMVITNTELYKQLAALLALNIGLLVAYAISAGAGVETVAQPIAGAGSAGSSVAVEAVVCTSAGSVGAVLLFYHGTLLAAGCYLAFSVRNMRGEFQESKAILFASYNVLLAAAIAVLLIVALPLSPTVNFAVQTVGTLYGASSATLCVMAPKLLRLANGTAAVSALSASGGASSGRQGLQRSGTGAAGRSGRSAWGANTGGGGSTVDQPMTINN